MIHSLNKFFLKRFVLDLQFEQMLILIVTIVHINGKVEKTVVF